MSSKVMELNKLLSSLQTVLDKLITVYRNLHSVLDEEYRHLTEVDLLGISEVTNTKEVLLTEIFSLEQIRLDIIDQISPMLTIPVGSATLKDLAGKVRASGNAAVALSLEVRQTTLKLLVDQTKDLNARNMDFAQSSLERIEVLKQNVLGLTNQSSRENYSQSGSRQPTGEQGGRLLSTEA